MDRELEYKLEAFDSRLKLYRTIVGNYQQSLIDGISSDSLRRGTEEWIRELRVRIKKIEKDRQNTIKRWK